VIVTGVDADGTYSGTVFRTDGTTRQIVVPHEKETDAEDASDAEAEALAMMDKMTPEQRDALRKKLSGFDVASDPSPAPAPDPVPSPAPANPPASDAGATQTGGDGSPVSPSAPSPTFSGNVQPASTTNGN
jgi:hypothetical protein